MGQIMALYQTGNKPLSEQLLLYITDIYMQTTGIFYQEGTYNFIYMKQTFVNAM